MSTSATVGAAVGLFCGAIAVADGAYGWAVVLLGSAVLIVVDDIARRLK